jgi:hypothetical protein
VPYKEVAELVRRGQLEEATQVCLDDYAVDISSFTPPELKENAAVKELTALFQEQLAMGHARELVWIAAAYAKRENWDAATRLARKSYQIWRQKPQTQGDLYVKMLLLAGNPSHPECDHSRLYLQTSVIAMIEEDMQMAIDSLREEQSKSSAKSASKKKDKCFIATAAYGSALAPDVVVLQCFRDTRLKRNWLGRRIVSLYERYSPPLADAIAQHPVVRLWVRRWVLSPLVWFVRRWTA